LSHHCNSQRLTHHRLALPRPEKGTVISGHSGTIGPRLFHPVPEREKEGKKRAEVHTYVRAGAARHLGLCRPLVARAGATTDSDRYVRARGMHAILCCAAPHHDHAW
jgi:hypothetical protein